MSWFEDFESSAASGEAGEAAETTAFPAVTGDPVTAVTASRSARPWIVGGSAGGVLVLGAVAVLSVANGLRAEPEAPPEAAPSPVTSTHTPAPSPSPTSSVARSPRCPDQPPASQDTSEGAVVAFQHAYFAGDANALQKALDPNSYLANVDWVTAAGELIGSDICVKIAGSSAEGIDADTTVRTPSGEELLLLQTITTTKAGGVWKVSTIKDRPIPTTT